MKGWKNMMKESYIPPVYIQIKNVLIEKINSGELSSGSQLPSEREISETYNISRMTARSALTQLVDSGYAYRLKGKGTFVKLPNFERDFVKLSGFSQMLMSKGIKPSNKVIEDVYKHKLKFSKQWIKITTLNRSESRMLDVVEHTPAFLLESISYDMDERIVEATRSLNIGDRTTFYTELWPSAKV